MARVTIEELKQFIEKETKGKEISPLDVVIDYLAYEQHCFYLNGDEWHKHNIKLLKELKLHYK